MWFLILVLAVIVGLLAVGIRSDLRRRRRAQLLGDTDGGARRGVDPRPDKVDLDVRSYVKLRETRDAPRNGGTF
jgi:hypothetical protein